MGRRHPWTVAGAALLVSGCVAPDPAQDLTQDLTQDRPRNSDGFYVSDAGDAASSDAPPEPRVHVLLGVRDFDRTDGAIENPLVLGVGASLARRSASWLELDVGLQFGEESDGESFEFIELYAGPRLTVRADGFLGSVVRPYVGAGPSMQLLTLRGAGYELQDIAFGGYVQVGLEVVLAKDTQLSLEYRALRGAEFRDTDGGVSVDADLDADQVALVLSFRY